MVQKRKIKFTLKQLKTKFGSEKNCLEFLFNNQYKNLKHCLKCGKITKHYLLVKKRRYVTSCGHLLFPTTNTIFAKSSTALVWWFHIIFLFSVFKNGISAKEIERQLGVTYKTAWRMAHKIRTLFDPSDNSKLLDGILEMDEAYIGGLESNKHLNKQAKSGFSNKVVLIGIKSRTEGKLVVSVEENRRLSTLKEVASNNIQANSIVMTDELPAYKGVFQFSNVKHVQINHTKKEYARITEINQVKVNVSINGIENFWSLFKHALKGTFIRLSKKYLQSYINEFVFRFNYSNDAKPLFYSMMERI